MNALPSRTTLSIIVLSGFAATFNAPVHAQDFRNGLTDADRANFYHTPEGSEIFPLDWILALKNAKTKKLFLADPERYGMIPEKPGPNNPYGLPVGLTAAVSRDTRFASIEMVGVNCAVCHTGEFRYDEHAVRVDGAPSLFNLRQFYGELIESTVATLSDFGELLEFLHRLLERDDDFVFLGSRPGTDKFLHAFSAVRDFENAGPLERAYAEHLKDIIDKELQRKDVIDLREGLKVNRDEEDVDESARRPFMGKVPLSGLKGIVAIEPGEGSPLTALASPARRESVLGRSTMNVVDTVRLLRARMLLLSRLVGGARLPVTEPGYGRIDAFVNARNLVYGEGTAIAPTSPVSYPHLWGFAISQGLHWDSNTNSVMERNIGQALGLGAVFDPNTNISTVRTRDIHRLEELARKITAPRWPAQTFGPIDESRAARGKALFANRCLSCHDPAKPDQFFAISSGPKAVNTDIERAQNFGTPIENTLFADRLSTTLKAVKAQAYTDDGIPLTEQIAMELGRLPSVWMDPKTVHGDLGYVGRPLAGAWATAPYLHNGSVPTLYDLLLPAQQRPKTFPLGHRTFDPEKVGYTTTVAPGPRYTFDTALKGNSNAGHEYTNDLSHAERMDLVEYLKTL